MKIITIILHFFVLCVFLQGCEEYEMIEYGEGGEINFMSDYYLGQNSKPSWRDDVEKLHYEVNFGINPLGIPWLMTRYIIGVKISGYMRIILERLFLQQRFRNKMRWR